MEQKTWSIVKTAFTTPYSEIVLFYWPAYSKRFFLKNNISEWDWEAKWLDDSLITQVRLCGNRLILRGVMIWGRPGTTEQWVDPFAFEIEPFFNGTATRHFTFSFCENAESEVTYEEYKNKPTFEGNEKGMMWKYIINSQKLEH